VAFHSKNGYDYAYVGNITTALDLHFSSEGPNEHDLALLPNGDVLCVMRTGAGDGAGGYLPFFKTYSSDGGRTWTKPEAMPNIGCARPHLVQLGDVTILTGGRRMLRHAYDRGFNIWASSDLGMTWEFASGSYHHNVKASMTGVPPWPAAVNETGWRFEFTSGYVGLVRVGESSAMVLYDLMLPIGQASLATMSEERSALLEHDFVEHNPAFSFSMRIDVVPKLSVAATVV
jgi:hypothetical protein